MLHTFKMVFVPSIAYTFSPDLANRLTTSAFAGAGAQAAYGRGAVHTVSRVRYIVMPLSAASDNSIKQLKPI